MSGQTIDYFQYIRELFYVPLRIKKLSPLLQELCLKPCDELLSAHLRKTALLSVGIDDLRDAVRTNLSYTAMIIHPLILFVCIGWQLSPVRDIRISSMC